LHANSIIRLKSTATTFTEHDASLPITAVKNRHYEHTVKLHIT